MYPAQTEARHLALIPNQWVKATWDDYVALRDHPTLAKAKSYYFAGKMRFEDLEVAQESGETHRVVGSDHARAHHFLIGLLSILGAVKSIPMVGLDNCSYTKSGFREVQPDSSIYLGERSDSIQNTSSVIDLDGYLPPDLVIEIAVSSLADDLGPKRLLYEAIQVSEYWIVDAKDSKIYAFQIIDQGSIQIQTSQVLAGLELSLVEEALWRSRSVNQSQVNAWLLAQFQL